jgi:hypothetical protein
MKQAKELVSVIKELAATPQPFLATVVSVDTTNNTCDVKVDDDEFGGVRLQAVVDENRKGLRLYPSVGSDVMVEPVDTQGNYRVSMFTEVDTIQGDIGNVMFLHDATGIHQSANTAAYNLTPSGHNIKVGSSSLLDALNKLIEAVQVIVVLQGNNPDYAKLTQAKTLINNILTN